jgi:hypothetical protein
VHIGPCHVSGIFLPLRVNSLPLATIYEVKIPLRLWKKSPLQRNPAQMTWHIGPCHVSGIFLPLRVKSLPLATIYEVKIPLRKWKKFFLQRNPAQMTSAIVFLTMNS